MPFTSTAWRCKNLQLRKLKSEIGVRSLHGERFKRCHVRDKACFKGFNVRMSGIQHVSQYSPDRRCNPDAIGCRQRNRLFLHSADAALPLLGERTAEFIRKPLIFRGRADHLFVCNCHTVAKTLMMPVLRLKSKRRIGSQTRHLSAVG